MCTVQPLKNTDCNGEQDLFVGSPRWSIHSLQDFGPNVGCCFMRINEQIKGIMLLVTAAVLKAVHVEHFPCNQVSIIEQNNRAVTIDLTAVLPNEEINK